MLLLPIIALFWQDMYTSWRDRLLLLTTLARTVTLLAVAGGCCC
jgi:hypothetical protein